MGGAVTGNVQYAELAEQLSVVSAVKRELGRVLPPDCPPATAAVLAILQRHGEMRMSKLAELLGVDMSVTSRHVAHVAERGWIDRTPDPLDGRSRLLRLTPEGERVLADNSVRYTDMLAAVLADWPDEDVAQLTELLARLRSSFGDCRPRAHLSHTPFVITRTTTD
jgi:DNA-binding MarR family transcriptional regulator